MGRLDQSMFALLDGSDRDRWVVAVYSLKAATSEPLELAEALVTEQTTGTWTAVPEETGAVKERSSGKVFGVYEVPDWERERPAGDGERTLIIMVGYPVGNINGQFPELLTTLYGNISMIGKLKLLDVWLPPAFLKAFKGPKFGVEGVRKRTKVEGRPLLCCMYKPCVGALPDALGRMAYEMALGGVDVIKDDELLADPDFCPYEKRIEVTEKALEKAAKETGRRAIYTVNVTDRPDRMHKKARRAVEMGASALMVNLFAVGYAAAQDLAEDAALDLPILGHPAFAGTLFEAPEYGMTSHLALGKFARLSGVDMIIYPSPYGKVPLLRERAIRVAQELRAPYGHIKAVFPGPAAGMHPGTVAVSFADFGTDLIVGAGGGIHGHPGGTVAGGKAFHQAIEAALKGVPAAEAAKTHGELKQAIEKWGDASAASNYSLLR